MNAFLKRLSQYNQIRGYSDATSDVSCYAPCSRMRAIQSKTSMVHCGSYENQATMHVRQEMSGVVEMLNLKYNGERPVAQLSMNKWILYLVNLCSESSACHKM